MKEIFVYLVDLYTTTLAPKIQQVIASGFQFFRLIESNPEGAAQHAGAALVTMAAVLIASFFLVKSVVALSKTLSAITNVIRWTFESIVEIAGNLRQALQFAVLDLFPKLLTREPYRGLVYWAAMLDREAAGRMFSGYKDGPIHLRYQLNMGFAAVALCTWSSLAFSYAVFSGGSSFDKPVVGLGVVAALGGVLYGAMIFALDRSIIAPFSNEVAAAPVTTETWGERILVNIYRFLPSALKLATRVVVALFVASFTALPLTMLILQGGISDAQGKPKEQAKASTETRLQGVQDARRTAISNRLASEQCRVATQAVAESQRRIDDMARAGCKGGKPTCPKDGTEYFENKHKDHVENQSAACTVSSAELKQFDDEISRLSTTLGSPITTKPVDILQGATILETLAGKEEANRHFKPVTATYYLLFIIELIPLLMKLWKEPLISRSLSP